MKKSTKKGNGNRKKRGWGVEIRVIHLREGEPVPEQWAQMPSLITKSLEAISEAPEVEYVEVVGTHKVLAAFAPRDVDSIASLLQGRCPALAALVRERQDMKLARELRDVLANGQLYVSPELP